jgi:hypothetical protein
MAYASFVGNSRIEGAGAAEMIGMLISTVRTFGDRWKVPRFAYNSK